MRFTMPEGFQAHYEHRQFEQKVVVELNNGHIITPRGFTHCTLFSAGGIVLAEGIAWCRDNDQFNKAIGRHIAQGRALKAWHTGTPTSGSYRNIHQTGIKA